MRVTGGVFSGGDPSVKKAKHVTLVELYSGLVGMVNVCKSLPALSLIERSLNSGKF